MSKNKSKKSGGDSRHLTPATLVRICQFLSQECSFSDVASRTQTSLNSVKSISAKLTELHTRFTKLMNDKTLSAIKNSGFTSQGALPQAAPFPAMSPQREMTRDTPPRNSQAQKAPSHETVSQGFSSQATPPALSAPSTLPSLRALPALPSAAAAESTSEPEIRPAIRPVTEGELLTAALSSLQKKLEENQAKAGAGAATGFTADENSGLKKFELKELVNALTKLPDDAVDIIFYPKRLPIAVGYSDSVANGKYYPNFAALSETMVVEKRLRVKDLYDRYLLVCGEKKAKPLSRAYFYRMIDDEIRRLNLANAENNYYFMMEFQYGEFVEIDFSGDTYLLVTTHSHFDCWLLVMTFPASYYTYATFVTAQSTAESCRGIGDFVRHFKYRIPAALICDNFKGAITKHEGTSIIINKNFLRYMSSLGVAISPCPVRAPQCKSAVEYSVGMIEAGLRANREFVHELETPKLFSEHCRNLQNFVDERINRAPFRKNTGKTREYLFRNYEWDRLKLVEHVPEFKELCENIPVPRNYHVCINNRLYSVPYTYINRHVTAEISNESIALYCQGIEIARHARIDGNKLMRPLKSTLPEHMPPKHQQIVNDNALFSTPEAIIDHARKLDGENGGLYVFCKHRLEYAKNNPELYIGNAMASCKSIIKYWERSSFKQLISQACQDVISQNPPSLWNKQCVETRAKTLISQAATLAGLNVSAGPQAGEIVRSSASPTSPAAHLSTGTNASAPAASAAAAAAIAKITSSTNAGGSQTQINYADHNQAWFTGCSDGNGASGVFGNMGG